MSRPVDVLAELDEAIAYFADRADVYDGDYGQPEPNECMRQEASLRAVRVAVAKLVAASEAIARRADNNVRSCGEIEMDSPELKALHAHLAKTWRAA